MMAVSMVLIRRSVLVGMSVVMMIIVPMIIAVIWSIRMLSGYKHINLRCRDSAAVNTADAKLSPNIQRTRGPLQQLLTDPGIDERAEHHVSADSREALEVSNVHSVRHPNLLDRQHIIHRA
jgi:hypothetical protein